MVIAVKYIIRSRTEWRFYGCEDNKSNDPIRCGGTINPLLQKASMGAFISGPGSWSIRRLHTWTLEYRERSLTAVYNDIQLKCQNYGLRACIIEEAKKLYKEVSDQKISRGAIREGLIAACVYMACNYNDAPRNAKEISEIMQIPITDITRGLKKYRSVMGFKAIKEIRSTKLDDFLDRFCSGLQIEGELRNKVKMVSENAYNSGIVKANTPPSIVAGSMLVVCIYYNIKNISKNEISKVCHSSQVTINKCFSRMYPHRFKLLEIEEKK